MKNPTIIAFSFFVYISILSCSKKKETVEPSVPSTNSTEIIAKSSDNKLYGVTIGDLSVNAIYIDHITDTVYFSLPKYDFREDIKNVRLILYPAEKASCSLKSISYVDLSNQLAVTVTAEDGSKKKYTFKPMYKFIKADIDTKYDTLAAKNGTLFNVENKYIFYAGQSYEVAKTRTSLFFSLTSYNILNTNIGKADSLLRIFSFQVELPNINDDFPNLEGDYSNSSIKISSYVNGYLIPLKGKFIITSYNSLLKTISGDFNLEGTYKSTTKQNPSLIKMSNGHFENLPVGRYYSEN